MSRFRLYVRFLTVDSGTANLTLGFSIGVLELHCSIFKISLYLAIINIVRMIKWKCLKSQAVDWKGKCTCSVHRRILNRQSRIVLLDLKNLTSLTRSLKSHLGCEKVQISDTTMCNNKDHRAKKSKGKKVGMWVGYDWKRRIPFKISR